MHERAIITIKAGAYNEEKNIPANILIKEQ
jgi:hypothetical protein